MFRILPIVFFLSLSICQDLNLPTTQENSKTEIDSLSILKDKIIEEANLEAKKIIDDANQIFEKAVDKEKKAENLINKAEKEADSIIDKANKTSTSIIATAKDSSSIIINESKNEATIIISNSNKKADKTISEARLIAVQQTKNAQKEVDDAKNQVNKIINSFNKRQAFIDNNAILVLSILSLIIISSFSFVVYKIWIWRKKINNNSIELPEIVREDIDNISQELKNLSTKEDEQITKNEVLELITKLKDALPNFGRTINETVLELDKKAELNYNEGLKLLRNELELKENKLKDVQNTKLKKKYLKKILEIRQRIEFFSLNNIDSENNEFEKILNSVDRLLKNEEVLVLSFQKNTRLEDLLPNEHHVIDKIQTNNEKDDQTVCKTVNVGYYFNTSDGNKVILRPADISIFIPSVISEKNKDKES
tara:strand:+ start:369 stop:1640 length:1272 start_codon:yes stop_codon:yes gene_type:complete